MNINSKKGFKMNNVSECNSVSEVLKTIGAEQDYSLRPISEFPTYRGVFDGNDNPVAIVNKTYPLMQPAKAFNYVDSLREGLDMTFDTAGFAKGGRRLFLSLRKKNAIEIDPKVGDTMDEVVYFWTSFDGSLQHTINKMLERLVCTNGMVARDSQSVVKVKHSAQMEDKLQGYVDTQMEEIKSAYAETKQIIYSLAETPVTPTDAREVINRLFKGESKRAENIRDEVFSRFSKGMGNRGETAWDLVNGITEYQNHGKAHRSSEASSIAENRLTSLTLGSDATLMNKVWDECMALN
jgi:phage/plasmid-like protein (TIGR03299 family)